MSWGGEADENESCLARTTGLSGSSLGLADAIISISLVPK